jgi:hypothetical protein
MGIVRRVGGLTAGTAGLVGSVLGVAGLAGVWLAYAEVMRRVDRVFGRADQALADVRDNLGQAVARLKETETELEAVRKREADLAAQPPAQRGARRELSRRAVESVGPGVGEARNLLVRATEAGLVANGLLDALAELPGDGVRVDTDRLKETATQIADLTEKTSKLSELLARAAPAGGDEVQPESTRAVEAVRRPIALAEAGAERLGRGRQSVAESHAKLRRWITGIAAALTVALVWIAAGQFSLLVHGWKLLRR